ncbi:DUF5663 domain-containing protein [Fodinicola acaciae]|uniref:DUF5663 domain-containing protein n=1 Tax=Fodinicola acaciae TaxID=2681555 RepID=UPI0013CFF854|nr:DUF5663 domain-containing protein [Fodinicola acaciae]
MKITLDNNLLIELGLSRLEARQKREVLERFNDVLELRVGSRIYRLMSDDQVHEFSAITHLDEEDASPNNNQEEGATWLAGVVPEHEIIVSQEFQHMKKYMQQRIPAIIADHDGPPSESSKTSRK